MKQVLMINLASFSDVITNSSSELFVIKDANKSKAEIETLLNATYPKWANEYDEPITINGIDEDDLSWLYPLILPPKVRCYDPHEGISNYRMKGFSNEKSLKFLMHNWKRNKRNTVYGRVATTLGIDPNYFWQGFKEWKPTIETIRYEGNPPFTYIDTHWYLEPTELGMKAIKNYFKNSWFLYSKDENPNWDGQEALSEIAYRIHMG